LSGRLFLFQRVLSALSLLRAHKKYQDIGRNQHQQVNLSNHPASPKIDFIKHPKMDQTNLIALLNRLRKEPSETEWLEFKAGYLPAQELGEYLSALANSACFHGKPRGYLVFGINNVTHAIVGTDFDPLQNKGKGNQDLLLWLSNGLQPPGGFEWYPFQMDENRLVLFEVYPALNQPVKFFGTAYIRVGSSKTELSKHPEKERAIWQCRTDWSAQVCEQAVPSDLDPEAISKARQEYRIKFPAKEAESEGWEDAIFLNKIGLAIRGNLTNSAILLLGKPESASLLTPAVSRISWILKDEKNQEKDYEHFDPPFILNMDRVLAKIRNLIIRQLPSGTLFPVEIVQYDPWVLREAIHNSIAHQDYTLSGRINLVELPDRLIVTNVGSFLPGNIETVIQQDSPLEVYRNPSLARAMVNLNMIDTQGGGIKRMFQAQMKRFFPMPDYDLSDPDRVVVTIRGKVINEQYTRLLMDRTDLDLWAVISLDKVQKGFRIEREVHQRLKKLGLVEGRYPKLYISASIAKAIGKQAQHIKTGGLNRKYYKDLILELIQKHGPVSRREINDLIFDKLPEILNSEQKLALIHNLIMEMRNKNLIYNQGTRPAPKWVSYERKKN
jgi:ATP-dependent DNA helicase RecG